MSMIVPDFKHCLESALIEARLAAERFEVPIGAVLVDAGGHVLAKDGNRTRELYDPTAHAEIQVIRAAGAIVGAQRMPETTLFVTLEPCAMCAAAISFARIQRVVMAALDPKGGGVCHGGKFYDQPTCHHRPEVVVLNPETPEAIASSQLLKDFFKARRG